MTTDLTSEIDAIETRIRTVQEQLEGLRSLQRVLFTKLKERLANGETTGDHIRDIVVRFKGTYDEELERRYRKLEERLQGKAGELVLFTYSINKCTRRVFVPTPRDQNEYDDFWYVVCGVLSNDKLRLAKRISLPIEQLITAGFSLFCEMKFDIEKDDPFDDFYHSSPALDGYADITVRDGHELMFLVGDDAVRLWFTQRRQPQQFRKCCDLLGKLVLEPTEAK